MYKINSFPLPMNLKYQINLKKEMEKQNSFGIKKF